MAYTKLKAKDARQIALDGFKVLTLYRNSFPWNCGLCLDGTIWGDCWCMFPKVLIWSHAVGIHPFTKRKNRTFFYNGQGGYYEGIGTAKSYDGISASGLGDWDGDTIMSCCTDVRSDFSKPVMAELLLIKGQHMAMYIDTFKLDGKTYNSVEFNYFNDEVQGLVPFWIDKYGQRFWCKGGEAMGGKFDLIGKLSKWIDYSKEPEPAPKPKQITVDGSWGSETTKLAQTVYGCKTINGKVVHQKKKYKKACRACIPAGQTNGSWYFTDASEGMEGYSPLIAKIQKELGIKYSKTSPSYGRFTKKTRKKLQKKIGTVVDGNFGPQSVRAFQRYINKKAKAM